MTRLPLGRQGLNAGAGRGPALLMARPGIAVATSAPVSLVVWATLPFYRPASLVPFLLCMVAAAVLVLAAELASFDRPERDTTDVGPSGLPHPSGQSLKKPGRRQWSDPAMVSVDRWLAHWPGVAGVSAVSWWAARVGAGGLLVYVGVHAAWPSAASATAVIVACVLAVVSLLPGTRHLVHLALGTVAATGIVLSASGAVALMDHGARGHFWPQVPLWPSASSPSPGTMASPGTVAIAATTTVVVLCLAAVCLPAVSPATSGGGRRHTVWVIWAAVGSAVATWTVAVPLLLRGAGLSVHAMSVAAGSPGALRSMVAVLLQPLAGSSSSQLAGTVLAACCMAGALGAVAGGTGLAETAMAAARATRAGRHGAVLGMPGTGQRQSVNRSLPFAPLVGTAVASGAAVGGAAFAGPRGWLVVALGSLASGALALTTLAPPVLRQCQRVPRPVRAWVGATWAIVVTVAIGAAGPATLSVVGGVALSGAFAMGWRGGGVARPEGLKARSWNSRHLAIPWSTAAGALVSGAAVMALEVLPLGGGHMSSAIWRGLGVWVMGAGIVVLAIFPATSRLRVEHMTRTALALSDKALPALAGALESLASGEPARSATAEVSDLKAATRPLESELKAYRGTDELVALTTALVEASRQIQRLAAGVEAVARLDGRRLEELVEERTAALSHVNRHLVDSQLRRRQLLDRTVRVAEGERARIAANLHDGPIQRLAALGLVMDRCRLRLDREDQKGAKELVKRARTELSNEIQNLRQMMSELRPPILDEGGLRAAISDQLSAWSAQTGIEARFEPTEHAPLSPNSEMVLYRVIQEALANIAKHSRASLATISIVPAGNGVQLTVRDNGRGFSTSSQSDLVRGGHFGLVVMRERVELAAGRFELKSAPNTGTEVTAWMPTISTSEPVEAA